MLEHGLIPGLHDNVRSLNGCILGRGLLVTLSLDMVGSELDLLAV